jgi:hypothetical protein
MKVAEQKQKCANPACGCAATFDLYCSEQCRDAMGQTECNCGHQDC